MQNTSSLFRILFFILALSFGLSAQKIQVGPYSIRVNGTQVEKNQWGPSEISYRIANDSLVFQVTEFQWDEKKISLERIKLDHLLDSVLDFKD